MNSSESLSKNPEMESLKQSLADEFPDIEFFKEGPVSKPDDKKTNVVWKVVSEDTNWKESFLKWFTKTGRVLWETEYKLIDLFNHFSILNNSSFSWPDISEIWETKDGWYYFLMKDAKQWDKKELDFSKMKPDEITKLYDGYRQTFDEFEKYSKWKTSTNSKMQRFYYFYKKYLQPEVSSESTIKSSKIINWAKTALCNVLQPAFKLAIWRKYKNLVNERISNGEKVVKNCDIDIDRERINKTLDKLLSKVKRFDFEYNFWRLWSWHVFSDGTNHKFVDFDNVGYQIEWTELICAMWDNLLNATWNYNERDWKVKYDERYNYLLEKYKDENLVKLLLFVKLIWTVFEDYGKLIYKKEISGGKEWQKKEISEEIKKWVIWNYEALQKLMDNVE